MAALKKRVLVTITHEIDIEIPEQFFDGMTEDQFIDEWSKGLWEIDSLDEVFKGAAVHIATRSDGIDLDGYGVIRHKDSSVLKDNEIRFDDDEPVYEVEFIE